MKFIEKINNVKLECGDFVLFGSDEPAIVIREDYRYKILYLRDGACDTRLDFSSLELLQKAIDEDYEGARIIKSKNIVITEV